MKTDLEKLSDYDRMVVEHNATHIYPRYEFDYRKEPVNVHVKMGGIDESKVEEIVAVLSAVTGQPVEYEPKGIKQKVYHVMKQDKN